MDADQFVRLCTSSGYASQEQAKTYISSTQKEVFNNEDLELIYRLREQIIEKAKARYKYIPIANGRTSKRYRQTEKMGGVD